MLSRPTRHDPAHNPVAESTDWRMRAACRDVDPEIFFPTAESGQFHDTEIARARAICAGCPVIEQCQEFARERLPYGIAGGMTPAERHHGSGRRARRRTPAVDGRHSDTAAAGRSALRAGARPVDVAREFGVSDRTVTRWAAANRAETGPATADTTVGRGAA